MQTALLQCVKVLTAAAAGLAVCAAAWAQEKTVGGLVINLGLMNAEKAVQAEGHRDAHPSKFSGGSQHLLITLADAKSHARVANAEVVVAVRDPRGHVEEKPLLHTQAAGLPDYSELFVFGWEGRYTLSVRITAPGAKRVETSFTLDHRL